MTYYDHKGDQVNKPKEIWLDEKLFDIPLQIEEELCRQVNIGLWKDEINDIATIQTFIKRSKQR